MYGQISNLYFTSQEAIYTQFATINNTVHRVVKSSRLLLKIAAYMYLDSIFFIAGSRQAFIFVLPGPKITSLHVSKFTPNLSYKPTVNCISLLTAGNFVVFWVVFIAWRCFDMSIWFNFCASIFQRHHFVQLWNPIPKPEDVTGCRSCRGLGNTNLFVTDIDRHVTESPGGGGGYSHTLPIRVCAAPRCRPTGSWLRGIQFRGVF